MGENHSFFFFFFFSILINQFCSLPQVGWVGYESHGLERDKFWQVCERMAQCFPLFFFFTQIAWIDKNSESKNRIDIN